MPERRKKSQTRSTVKKSASKKSADKKIVKVKKGVVKKIKKVSSKKAAIKASDKIGSLTVYDMNGKSVEQITIDPLFHEGAVNTDVIHQAVVMYQAGMREGTAATKDRGHVSGGGKKPWKQKGTGRARHASIRSPLWRGGGTTFGPMPRDYSYSIPAQLKRKAVAEVVKDKVVSGKLFMLNQFELDKPKTKGVIKVIKALKIEKPLFLVDKKSDNLVLASRNIPGVALKTAEEVNAYDVVSHRECVMTQNAYKGLLKRLKS